MAAIIEAYASDICFCLFTSESEETRPPHFTVEFEVEN